MDISAITTRLEHAKTELRHSKMKYILYAGFSRSDVNHTYRYTSSEMSIKSDRSNKGSWDIVIADTNEMKRGSFVPVFVEVKSQYSDNEKLISDLIQKISDTRKLIENDDGALLIDQIPTYQGNGLKVNKDRIEFAIFLPSSGATGLIDYIDKFGKSVSEKIGIVIWTLENVNPDEQAIGIPYISRNKVKSTQNIGESECSLCYCRHNDNALTRWFEQTSNQRLERGGLLPPKLTMKWVDPAVAVTILLASGRIFRVNEKYLTKRDLVDRFKDLYNEFKVEIKDEEIDSYVSYMERMGILRKEKGIPLEPFRLNTATRGLLRKNEGLLEDVVARAVKNKVDSSSGFFSNV